MSSKNLCVAIISFSPITRDARVLRQIEYLSKHYPLTVIGFGDLVTQPDVKMISIGEKITLKQKIKRAYKRFWHYHVILPPARIRKAWHLIIMLLLGPKFPQNLFETWYWEERIFQETFEILLRVNPDIIHANDWNTLPIADRISKETGALVISDLHEYAPLEAENHWAWRITQKPMIEYFLRKCIPNTVGTITVNQTIAEKYASEFGFQPIVVMNSPKGDTRTSFKSTQSDVIRLIHHGGAMPDRELELMIETMKYLDNRFFLHFMLVGDQGYIKQLNNLAHRIVPGKVFFESSVRPEEVVNQISRYDMGFYLLPPLNYNNAVALPNKFFDFINAGLAVCVGPSIEMARITREYKIGVIAPSFRPVEVSRALNQLTSTEIDQMKNNSIRARNILNAQVEMEKLMCLYKELSLRQ